MIHLFKNVIRKLRVKEAFNLVVLIKQGVVDSCLYRSALTVCGVWV